MTQSTHSPDVAKAGAEIDGLTATNIVLSLKEICAITGYKTPTMQLGVLRKRGYYRAVIGRKGVVLTRTHFDAVTAETYQPAPEPERDYSRLDRPAPLHWRMRPENRVKIDAIVRQRLDDARKNQEMEAMFAELKQRQAEMAPMLRRELVRFHASRRRVAKINRTPSWADQTAIRAVYAEALRRKQETGEEHHVDHIIPLQGVLVSGLHVENNLQVLHWRENIVKRNRFEVEQ